MPIGLWSSPDVFFFPYTDIIRYYNQVVDDGVFS